MQIERFYLACLSHASYIVVSEGEAAVIDPQRDVDLYIDYLERGGLQLRYVIETHLHADFVSGHIELAKRAGAKIVMGLMANADFPHLAVGDGDELELGAVMLRVIETPGHTPEGITIAATDTANPDEPIALFTGDTLFAGDVGRPDLLDGSGMSKAALAGMLYDSLHRKILTFSDDTRVYPAHGAGSSCGKALRNVEFSTIGTERLTNYALKPMSREEFVTAVTEGQPEAPRYFSQDARINRSGAPEMAEVMGNARPLSPDDLEQETRRGAVLLDTRAPEEFARGFIPGSINIGLDGQFASWVGTLLPIDTALVIVAPRGREEETVIRCARVGYDNVVGWVDGGFEAWRESGRTVDGFERVDPAELARMRGSENSPLVLDVRRDGERAGKSIAGTEFITLSRLDAHARDLQPDGRPIVVHCALGYRSSIAASILKSHGFTDVLDLRGGIGAWESAGLPIETSAIEAALS